MSCTLALALALLASPSAPQEDEVVPGAGIRPRGELLLDQVLATVNDQAITFLEVERLARLQFRTERPTPQERERAFSDLLLDALFQEGFRLAGLDSTLVNRIVEDEIERQVEQAGSMSALVERLAQYGSTVEHQRQRRRRELSAMLFREVELGRVPEKGRDGFKNVLAVPPREVVRYYEEHLDEFRREHRVTARILLVREEPAGARARLDELLARISSEELDFETACRESSAYRPTTGSSTGHVRPERSNLVPAIKSFLETAAEGAISEPIEMPNGWAAVYAERVTQPGVTPLEDVQLLIAEKLLKGGASALLRETVARLRKRCTIWGEGVDVVLDGLFRDASGQEDYEL